MPIGKLDLLVGYALAFGLVATVQAVVATGARRCTLLGLDVAGPLWLLLVVAVLDAVLGMALGLFVSAFAATEFQAVQFMPAFVLPQFLLCGLLVPRDQLDDVLRVDLQPCCRCPTPSTLMRDLTTNEEVDPGCLGRPLRRRAGDPAGAGSGCRDPAPSDALA